MAITRFNMLYNNMVQTVGKQKADELFPEYRPDFPSKMPQSEQIELSRTVMSRMDDALTKNEIQTIRRACSCNIPKAERAFVDAVKETTDDPYEVLAQFGKTHMLEREGNVVTYDFGIRRCQCGMFNKTSKYEPVSKTWCECCNGNVIKTFRYITGGEVDSQMLETIASGGNRCRFRVTLKEGNKK